MSRPTTKADFIAAANENYDKLNSLINSMTEKELATPFSFEGDEKKKEAHWIFDAYGMYVGPEPAPYTHTFLS